jgi:uncharacterized protein DUF4167
MKQNNNNRRARGRGPRKPHGMGGGQHKVQGYESGGQELRVRGNAYQVLEKYLQLARDAGAAGDRVAAENFLQHADHYYRVLSAMNDGQRPRMGGRELSVADVNVQNVSQGLSAALYNSGGPNPQGMDTGMGDGQNPSNQGGGQVQGGQGHSGQGHGGQNQGAHRQGSHQHGSHQHGGQQHGGHQQGGHQQGGHQQDRSQGEGQGGQQPVSGNVAQGNGHGNNYGNYDRADAQPSYSAPSEPVRAAAPPPSEAQPDYPDELLPAPAAPAAASEAASNTAEEGVQRTVRTPRPRLRGKPRGQRQSEARQGEGRQSEGRQSEGRQSEGRQGGGQGQADSD